MNKQDMQEETAAPLKPDDDPPTWETRNSVNSDEYIAAQRQKTDAARKLLDLQMQFGGAKLIAQRVPRVSRGRTVHTHGPWSNGHDEQCAVVTHVHGDGTVPGTLVNLTVFVDQDMPMISAEIPWFPTRAEALNFLKTTEHVGAGPRVCWFPELV